MRRLALALIVVLAACGGAAPTPRPMEVPTPTPRADIAAQITDTIDIMVFGSRRQPNGR